MSRGLLLTPFYALNPTQKAAILAFICNELLCNKDINAYVATALHYFAEVFPKHSTIDTCSLLISICHRHSTVLVKQLF